MDLLNLGTSNVYLDSVWWSLDGCSHLLGLYNTGTLSSFLNCGAPLNYEKLRRIKKEGNPFVILKNLNKKDKVILGSEFIKKSFTN